MEIFNYKATAVQQNLKLFTQILTKAFQSKEHLVRCQILPGNS